jgi:hypothetical protein
MPRLCALLVRFIAPLLVAAGLPASGSAESIVFDNFNGEFSIANVIGESSAFRFADDFSFLGSTEVSGVRFWGSYSPSTPPASDDFTITFYGDDGSDLPDPGNIIASINVGDIGRVDTGIDSMGADVFLFEATFAPIVFGASEKYWLSITNDITGPTSTWLGDIDDGNNAMSTDSGSSWHADANAGYMQFQLIPEPNSGLLLAMGLAGLAAGRRHARVDHSKAPVGER